MSSPPDRGAPAVGTPADRLERLWPSAGVWLGALVTAGFCGVVALPFGPVPGLVTAVAALGLMAAALLRAAAAVGVRGGEFVARRAHVPLDVVGEVTVLDAAGMRAAHGPGLDARAFLCLRGWVRTGLRLDLLDPADPTPYWLVSARRPGRLLEAVQEHRRAG